MSVCPPWSSLADFLSQKRRALGQKVMPRCLPLARWGRCHDIFAWPVLPALEEEIWFLKKTLLLSAPNAEHLKHQWLLPG